MFASAPDTRRGDAVAYKSVRLVDDRGIVDLYVYNSRGKGLWNSHAWLEEGRPRELSSLNLSTWSLLTTSIREYQRGSRQYASRIYLRMFLPVYGVWMLSLFVDVGLESVAFFMFCYFFLIVMLIVSIMVAAHYKQKHADEVFHPAVATVINELAPKLTETGYDVVYMVETGEWFQKPTTAFLRFTPIPDEERRATENAE